MSCFVKCCRVLKSIPTFKPYIVVFTFLLVIVYRHVLPLLASYSKLSAISGLVKDSTTKYILVWSSYQIHPFHILIQQGIFTKNKCKWQNCIVSPDRDYFKGDLTKFDAIAIDGRKYGTWSNYLQRRTLQQKLIYVNTGSAWLYPICSSKFQNVFNWTMTYKLNSDVPYPFIQVRDKSGTTVGPKIDMQWKVNMTLVDDDLISKTQKKNKAVAWFTSDCYSAIKRDDIYMGHSLKKELKRRGYDVDIFGPCGKYQCNLNYNCNSERVEEYYFLLAYEENFAEDYVTAEVLRALWHYTVPVVYGGANYSRFLPPNSYVNARYISAPRLAMQLVRFIENPQEYQRFFGWRKHYTFHNPMDIDNVCALCAAMNDPKFMIKTEYKDLRAWWNPEPPLYRCEFRYNNTFFNV